MSVRDVYLEGASVNISREGFSLEGAILEGNFTLELADAIVPADVIEFLIQRGWRRDTAKGETSPKFMHDNRPNLRFAWYQAISIEYMMFITLGGVQSR